MGFKLTSDKVKATQQAVKGDPEAMERIEAVAAAQAAPPRQRWEYKARNLQKVLGPMMEGDFNKLGWEGWEFVAMAQGGKSGYAIFKRPLDVKAEADGRE